MKQTREELDELLKKSKESLMKTREANRSLHAVMTKVHQVVGKKRPVKLKPPK